MDDPKPPQSPTPSSIDPADLRILMDANVQLIGLLRDLGAFAAQLEQDPDPEVAARAAIVPLDLTRSLLKPKRGKTDQFSFTVDSHGRQLGTGRTVDQQELDDLLAPPREMGLLLALLRIELSDLAAAGLLPPNLNWASIQAAETLLTAWTPSPFPNRDVANALAILRALGAALQDNREKLSSGLRLARRLAIDSDVAELSHGLRALARYQPLGPSGRARWSAEQFAAAHPDYPDLTGQPLPSEPREIETWLAQIADQTKGRSPARSTSDLWDLWRPRLLKYFEGGPAGRIVSDIAYDELVATVQEHVPSALLSRSLVDVSPYGWSRLALHVLRERLNRKRGQPPLWALVAALRALGFNGDVLKGVASSLSAIGPTSEDEQITAERFAKGVRKTRAGALAIINDGVDTATLIPVDRRPTLYVDRSEMDAIMLGLNALESLEAFAGVFWEHGQTA